MVRNKWIIKVSKNNGDVFDLSDSYGFGEHLKDKYVADPFVIKWHGQNYLFFELYDYKKGVIACKNLDDLGEMPGVVLEEPYHLSFPCVFEDNGKLYMVPESGANGTIDLYEAENPYKWSKVKTLVSSVCAGDPVISKAGNTYFLEFTDSGDENLRVYRSDSLFGVWEEKVSKTEPHSRNAGHVFEYGDEVIFPKQDSKEYGKRIYFKTWNEEIIKTIEGIHTFNFNDDYIVTDYRIEETLDS